MAYTKTTWQNNVTDIDANNLNKMEQGIYDNSLVVEAVTNTLNPTDTETYKTAELTEGQITDVIGVSDIIIKGQTSQDGEPTPSAPVDVNVVSGSNVISTSNKNLLDKDGEISQGSTNNTADTTRLSIRVKHKLKANTTYTVITNLNTSNFVWAFVLGTKVSPWSNAEQLYDSTWKNTNYWSYTTSQECYINIPIRKTSSADINANDVKDYWFMLYEGAYDSSVSYEPHQGKELPLDLPVENLFDKDNSSLVFNGFANRSSLKLDSNASAKTICQPCKPNTTYTISKILSARFFVDETSSSTISNGISITPLSTGSSSNVTSHTVTTSASAKYLLIYYYVSSADTLSEEKIRSSIQIEQGSKANAYTPYGTDPIELCKIGNYQDYFYKSGSKWYLHKEIGKVVLDGTETWGGLTDLGNCIRVNTSFQCKYYQQFSDYFKYNDSYSLDEEHFYNYSNYFYVFLSKTKATTVEEFKTWLSNHNTTIYYVLATATDTEITDTTLISQLEAIYNAPLYEQTNITQENNDLPMVLDVTACKDNINGIKAFIRK